jgi:LacI family transcriptional regulator
MGQRAMELLLADDEPAGVHLLEMPLQVRASIRPLT